MILGLSYQIVGRDLMNNSLEEIWYRSDEWFGGRFGIDLMNSLGEIWETRRHKMNIKILYIIELPFQEIKIYLGLFYVFLFPKSNNYFFYIINGRVN